MKATPNIEIKEGTLEEVVALSLQIPEFIDPHPIEEYQRRLQHTPHLVLIAYANQIPVGFKVGYEREGYFYSWMGAVLPAYRRHNAATLLAEAQENWAIQQGYPHVTFKTRNHLKSMLLFAIKRGFYILAVEERDKVADYRILLRKFFEYQKILTYATKKTVHDYLTEHEHWQEILIALTDIIHSTELVETVKWGMPTYMIDKKNVITLGAFKNHVALWFIQGVFLEDPYHKLVNAQAGRTKAMRHWRFTKIEDVEAPIIKVYIEEAIQNQKDGKEIKTATAKVKKPLIIPALLQAVFDNNQEVKAHFDLLKLTQKRNLCNFIDQAKQLKTKQRRIERIIPLILAGRGIYE